MEQWMTLAAHMRDQATIAKADGDVRQYQLALEMSAMCLDYVNHRADLIGRDLADAA